MNYYKLINNNTIVGVVSQVDMRKYQMKHNLMLTCTTDKAEYAEFNGIYYHDDWMKPANDEVNFIHVTITPISEPEYDALLEAFETEDEIEIDIPEEIEPEMPEEQNDILLFIKASKLKEISTACETAITYGVDVTLSDNESHHFSASLEDQINLLSLHSLAVNGEENIPYHADGELCKFYSPSDILEIVNAITEWKSFHTTYHNSLKAYVESLDDLTDLTNVEYGMDIPFEFQSDILIAMYKQMGGQDGMAE